MSNDDPILCWTTKTKRSDVENMIKKNDQTGLSDFIKVRFNERYIRPLEGTDKHEKHGFCIMAISCLMIEALQSFRRGWKKTTGLGELAFCSFFQDNDYFREFSSYGCGFYRNVRCGILHQAETTGGWTIRRKGRLFDSHNKRINATEFHKRLQAYLDDYCIKLQQANQNDYLWENCKKKLWAICKNCDA